MVVCSLLQTVSLMHYLPGFIAQKRKSECFPWHPSGRDFVHHGHSWSVMICNISGVEICHPMGQWLGFTVLSMRDSMYWHLQPFSLGIYVDPPHLFLHCHLIHAISKDTLIKLVFIATAAEFNSRCWTLINLQADVLKSVVIFHNILEHFNWVVFGIICHQILPFSYTVSQGKASHSRDGQCSSSERMVFHLYTCTHLSWHHHCWNADVIPEWKLSCCPCSLDTSNIQLAQPYIQLSLLFTGTKFNSFAATKNYFPSNSTSQYD